MDPRKNPYAPGAGTPPQALVGRDTLISNVDIQLDRCRNQLSHRGFIMVGLRGVGKTVLLTHLSRETAAKEFIIVSIEASEGRSLPALLVPELGISLLKLNKIAALKDRVGNALKVLGGFINAFKMKFDDIEFHLDLGKESGADTGDLEHDLSALFVTLGEALREKKTALVLFIDEIQYIERKQFASLIMALHKCAQQQLPIALVAAGLPQIVGQAGHAKSYAERLFEYPQIGALDESSSKEAIQIPASQHGVEYEKAALKEIYAKTHGHPYFLQEWGKHCWENAKQSPITVDDVKQATQMAITHLDSSFFRVRFDRLTPTEKRYLRAMAELGPGPYKSGDIANLLDKKVQAVAPIRAKLIDKGMIFGPSYGDSSFTVPLFDEYMKRAMPELL